MKQLVIAILIMFYGVASAQISSFEKQRGLTKGGYLNFGYHQTDFLNSRYRTNIQDDNLSKSFGYYIGITHQYNPLIVELTYFRSNFTSNILSNQFYGNSTNIRHEGIELTLSLNLLPDIPVLNPFIGFGFQGSYLSTPTNKEDNPNIKKVSQVGTSSPIWTSGLNLQFKSSIAVSLRYKASLLTNRENYQLAVGLLYTLDFLKLSKYKK